MATVIKGRVRALSPHFRAMQKWLLLQTTKMETTCFKKKEGKNLLFFIIIPHKNGLSSISNGEKVSKCCQIVAKIRVLGKRKSPKSLFDNNLGDFFCGAYGTRTRDPMRDRHVF